MSDSVSYKQRLAIIRLRFDKHHTYLIFVIFFTRTKFLENKIYTEETRKLRQNTQKIAIFLRYYGKIHSKLTIFRVKSVKIYTGQKKFTRTCSWGSWQISGMTRLYQLEGCTLPQTFLWRQLRCSLFSTREGPGFWSLLTQDKSIKRTAVLLYKPCK